MVLAPTQQRKAAFGSIGAVFLGAAAGFAGMLVYPGGTWFEPQASGYDFWLNFLCDAMHSVALSGKSNKLGALLTQTSLIVLMLGLIPLWLFVPGLFPKRAMLGKFIRFGGCAATLAMVIVPLTPSDRFGILHGVAVTVAGPLGIGAVIAILFGLWSVKHEQAKLALLTLVLVGLSFADLLLYLCVTWLAVPLMPALPIVQKLAFLLTLLWMLGLARALLQQSSLCARDETAL